MLDTYFAPAAFSSTRGRSLSVIRSDLASRWRKPTSGYPDEEARVVYHLNDRSVHSGRSGVATTAGLCLSPKLGGRFIVGEKRWPGSSSSPRLRVTIYPKGS